VRVWHFPALYCCCYNQLPHLPPPPILTKICLGHTCSWQNTEVGTPYTDSGDSYNTTVGIYSTNWTGGQGFFLNEQHVKIRGFCNHESFGGVGMAIPDRVNLFRAQGLRSVGSDSIATAHPTRNYFRFLRRCLQLRCHF
jgi:hypothetical protein